MRLFGIPLERRPILLLLGALGLALLATWLAHVIRFGADGMTLGTILRESTGATALFVGTSLLMLYLAEGYEARVDFRRQIAVFRLGTAVVVAMVAQMLLFYLLPHWWLGRGVVLLTNLSFGVLVVLWRALISLLRPTLQEREPTLIVGAGAAGQAIARLLLEPDGPDPAFLPVGFLADDTPPEGALQVLGPCEQLEAMVERVHIRRIIVAQDELSPALTRSLLALKARGLLVEDMPTVYKRLTGKVPVHYLSEKDLLFGPHFAGIQGVGRAAQRLVDLVLSLIGLLLSLPLLIGAAIAIKLDSPGPVFFTQERVGLGEAPFTILKLRTMAPDAEARSGPVWSQGAGDMRVTRVGRFLRRSRIDELPQLINVLRGDMAFVGPRPERAFFIARLKESIPFYALRFAVKPGLTGWAQVRYRYGASEEDAAEKLCYELYAVQEMSVPLYVLILLKTVQTVLLRPGS